MRVLGIDYGERRIGLAISDASGLLARPWRTISHGGSLSDAVETIACVAATLEHEEDGLRAIVVGLPRRLDGTANEQTARVESFTRGLRARTAVPIQLHDERLTSHEAESRLALREPDWRKRKAKLDAAAAAVMLQEHLDRGVAIAQPDLRG